MHGGVPRLFSLYLCGGEGELHMLQSVEKFRFSPQGRGEDGGNS